MQPMDIHRCFCAGVRRRRACDRKQRVGASVATSVRLLVVIVWGGSEEEASSSSSRPLCFPFAILPDSHHDGMVSFPTTRSRTSSNRPTTAAPPQHRRLHSHSTALRPHCHRWVRRWRQGRRHRRLGLRLRRSESSTVLSACLPLSPLPAGRAPLCRVATH